MTLEDDKAQNLAFENKLKRLEHLDEKEEELKKKGNEVSDRFS